MKKIMALLALILCIHIVYNMWISKPTLELLVGEGFARQVRKVDASVESDPDRKILFFGDSVNWHTAPDDSNKGPISWFLDHKLRGVDVVAVDHKAFHMGVYSSYADYILKNRQINVGLMIVPINLRSFSTHFYRNWSWQFNDLQRCLRHDGPLYRLSFRPCGTFRVYADSDITEETFMGLPVYDGDKVVGRVHEYSGAKYHVESYENVRDKIIFYYMQPIDATHERVQQLREMAELCSEKGQKVIFYVTPVDYKTCDGYLHGRFSTLIASNVELLRSVLAESGHELLDLSFALEPSLFYYGGFPLYPNEHLNEEGRRWVASRLYDDMVKRDIFTNVEKKEMEKE